MDKQDMIRRFKSETGSWFINRKKLADLMGQKDAHKVDWVLSGLERTEKGRLYYIPDVVGKILDGTEVRV